MITSTYFLCFILVADFYLVDYEAIILQFDNLFFDLRYKTVRYNLINSKKHLLFFPFFSRRHTLFLFIFSA